MDSGSRPIRVFLVAEHAVLRQNLALLLEEEGMVICGVAGGASEALRAMPAETDVAIVALSGTRQGVLQLVREIGSRPGAPPSLVLSVDDDDCSVRAALAAGARGYVPNRRASEVLAYAVREAVAGRTSTPPLAAEAR
jgi:DNA-binding NarL/FixJ family response regulator